MEFTSYAVITIIKLLGLLNLAGARIVGRYIGWFLRVSNSVMYQVTCRNIELCYPYLHKHEQEVLANASIDHAGMSIAETGIAWAGGGDALADSERYIKQVHNLELFNAALASDKGLMMVVPHFGNWEFLNSWLPGRCEVTVLYKMAKMPAFERWMLKQRQRGGVKLVRGNRAGVEKIFEQFCCGGTVLFAPDQEPSRKSGVWAPFYDIPALTSQLPHQLLQKNPKGVVLYCFLRRVEGGFDLHFNQAPAALYDQDPVVSATALNKGFAQCIAEDPAQYQWNYRRFKRRPEGVPSLYIKRR